VQKRTIRKAKIMTGALLFLLAGATMVTVQDLHVNSKLQRIGADKRNRPKARPGHLLYEAAHGRAFDLLELGRIKKFVDRRYDTSDFRLQSVLRLLYDYSELLTPAMQDTIKAMLLGFKYWMDEPGRDSMCFWSENHQILFAAAEYLAGQHYPDEIFTNDGRTGVQHQESARRRLVDWLKQRWQYGFVEWNSNTYYVEDIAPLANLVDFAKDEEIVIKSKIILDLMVYDLASQSFRGTFVSSMGRAYERGRKSGQRASTRSITEHLFGWRNNSAERRGMDLNFIYCKNYNLPLVLREIGRDTSKVIIKVSTGLNIDELGERDLIGPKDRQIMMQWAMEAFSQPQVINNSLDYINAHKMQANSFLYNFRMVNYRLLRWFGLLPIASHLLNPVSNGTAIQRANLYTYKTPHYSMYTAQSYHPGEYGDQHHVFGVTLSSKLSVFHNHPSLLPGEKPDFGNSPTYWVGYGRLPHSVQDKNINLSIYKLPKKKGFLEKRLLHFTQFYCPKEQFDEFIINGRTLFLRYGHAFLAVRCAHDFHYDEEQQAIIQPGAEQYYICEMSTNEQESFSQFQERITKNPVAFNGQTLSYASMGKGYELSFGNEFCINGKVVDTNYPRFDSPYIRAEREPEEMVFHFRGHSLRLHFERLIRQMTNVPDASRIF